MVSQELAERLTNFSQNLKEASTDAFFILGIYSGGSMPKPQMTFVPDYPWPFPLMGTGGHLLQVAITRQTMAPYRAGTAHSHSMFVDCQAAGSESTAAFGLCCPTSAMGPKQSPITMAANGQKRSFIDQDFKSMNTFTKIIVWVFVAMLLATAALIARSGGDLGLILFSVGLALFFIIVARMAEFEARFKIGKESSALAKGGLKRQFIQYWNAPTWEGKFLLGFFVLLIAVRVVQSIYSIAQSGI